MINKLADYILKDTQKLVAKGKNRRIRLDEAQIRKGIEKFTKPGNSWLMSSLIGGVGPYQLYATLLQASYTKQYESLFTDAQRQILAKKMAVSAIAMFVSFVVLALVFIAIGLSQ